MSAISYPPPKPFLVVFGRDNAGKPHASWFDQASAELATKAAGLMNMHAVPIETDELRELAGSLPRGRVFSSGRAFTPFIKGNLYSRLVELTRDLLGLNESETAGQDEPSPGTAEDDRAGTSPQAEASDQASAVEPPTAEAGASATKGAQPKADKPSARPTRADEVGQGSLVLATTGPGEGWWEAEVIGINGTMLTLRFRDYAEPTVVRRRAELGFLPALQG